MPDQRKRRPWVRDPFLFAMALGLLGMTTIGLAISGRLFGDPALIGLAVASVLPAFWLFYLRGRTAGPSRPNDRSRRR